MNLAKAQQMSKEVINEFVQEQQDILKDAYTAVLGHFENGNQYPFGEMTRIMQVEVGLCELRNESKGNYKINSEGLERIARFLIILNRPKHPVS